MLALKDNPPTRCEDVQRWLDAEVTCGRLPVQETVEKDPGRMEIRRIALNVLRHKGPVRDGLRQRKIRAALNDSYRLNLILGTLTPATT